MPEWHAEILLHFDRAFTEGWASEPSDAVLQVLGRPSRSLAACFEDLLPAGA